MPKTKEITTVMSEDTLAMLEESYPVEQGNTRISLPRLGMMSQDKMEGKGKSMVVVAEAGTFFTEKQSDEEDETGKKLWEREELGDSIEAIILFQRKQLKSYDESTEEYTSSPVYDSDDEVIPLWLNKKEVARNTPVELKKMYQYTDKEGKVKSSLEDNRILYVQYQGDVYQMNLRGSSMYSFLTYAKKTLPPSVLTTLSSEPKEKGTISWNQMTFTAKRKLTEAEAQEIVAKVVEIKQTIAAEKSQYKKVDEVDRKNAEVMAEM